MHRYLLPLALLAAIAAVLLAPAVGRAGSLPSMAWTPSTGGTYDYGAVTPGQTASNTFTLTNSGGSATGALRVELSGTGAAAYSIASDACTGTALGKGKSCAVTVQYAPTGAGSDTAMLTVNGKKSSTTASVDLTGSGAAGTPDLSLSPYTIFNDTDPTSGTKDYFYDFGVAASRTQTFTVTNNGTGPATGQGSGLLVSVLGSNFAVSNDTCSGFTLAAGGATCTFDITATAPTACDATGTFGPAPVFVDIQDNGSPYIFVTVVGECP